MRKQTISKIAAIALVAMTVVPSFGLSASAAITTFDAGTPGNGGVAKAWGKVNKAEFQLNSYDSTYYKVVEDVANSTEAYKQYKLEEVPANRKLGVFTKHDIASVSVPTQDGSATISPYVCVYYTDERVIPATGVGNGTAYGKDKSGAGSNGIITKSEADTNSDYTKAVKVLNALNAELKSYGTAVNNAKNNVDKTYSFTTHDGKTIYAVMEGKNASTKTITYYKESNAMTPVTDYTPLSGTLGLTLTAMKEENMACGLTGIKEGDGFYKYTYNYTHSITEVDLTTAMNDLQIGAYVDKNSEGILIKPASTPGGYLVTKGGETVSGQNPDGSGSSGTANPGGSTVTPSTKFDWSLSYSPYYNLYSPSRRLYFPSPADAIAAGATDYRIVSGPQEVVTPTYESSTTVSTTFPWYSTVTGRYYKTSSDAIAASGGSSSSVYNYYEKYYYNLYYGLYGYGYGYGYGYTYPTTTTKVTDNSNVTIGKYKGWTYVNRYIKSAKTGTSYTVSMNGETSIPSTVLSSLYGKDVTVNFKFNSGAILSINGKNLSSTSSISTDIKYNVKNVPSSLVKKAVKSNDGISTAQFSISGGNMSASASVTIKFKASRAGCTAKLYRYNSSSNSLSLVSSTVIKSNGNGVFDKVSQGGSYLVVLS